MTAHKKYRLVLRTGGSAIESQAQSRSFIRVSWVCGLWVFEIHVRFGEKNTESRQVLEKKNHVRPRFVDKKMVSGSIVLSFRDRGVGMGYRPIPTHTHSYKRTHVQTHTYTHIHTNTHIHTHTNTHTRFL